MGTMFGAHLALEGHDVTLVDVDTDHINAVRDRGVTLRHSDGTTQVVELAATTNPEHDLSLADGLEAVIVLCKGWANEAAGASIAHAVGHNTWLVTVQNGLGNDRSLATVLPADRVVAGTTTAGALKREPGIVEVTPITSHGGSITQLGPPAAGAGAPDSLQLVADALTQSGLPCEIHPNADMVIWTKLALAGTAGPLTAALNATVADVVTSPAARELLRALFDEIVEVAGATGVDLDAPHVWDHAIATFDAVGPHTTSMADDLATGRRSEIDSFSLEISRLGTASGVPTPTHDTIGRLIVAREQQGGLR
jgi:2-dehydropantoate 2-reductase